MEIDEKKLESLFGQLVSGGKAKAIEIMVETMPKKFLEKAIESYSFDCGPIKAAELAEKVGLTEKAQKLYSELSADREKKGYWCEAEKYAEKAGLGIEKIQELAMKAMKEDEKEGYIEGLAHYAMRAGLGIEKAQELAMKACTSLLTDDSLVGPAQNAGEIAGKIAEEVGLIEKSIECYEKGRCWEEAIALAEKAGLTEKAQELYIKAYKSYRSYGLTGKRSCIITAEYAEKAGMIKEALECYERGEVWEEAIALAEKAGLTEKAQEIGAKGMIEYEWAGMFSEAAELAEKIGSEKLQLYRTLEKLIQK